MRAAELGLWLRTLRHIRPVQIAAQLRHAFTGEVHPVSLSGPAHQLRISSSAVAFLPNPAHAHCDGIRSFELINRSVRFREKIDWDHQGEGPLWTFHLNQFDYARDPLLSPSLRLALIEDWIENCDDGIPWRPHPITLRILSWGKLLLTPGALNLTTEQSERICRSLADQAETLSRGLEVRLQANHLFSNILGVIFAGLLLEGPRSASWLSLETALLHEIDEQILDDGSHIEASPMYHGLLLENLLDVLNLAKAPGQLASDKLVAGLEVCTRKMLGAHRVWTHPDGEIALFSDSALDIAHPPSAIEAYARELGVECAAPEPAFALRDAGVARLESRDLTLIAKASAPSPTYMPGHAHCDALSFELSIGKHRVVTDTGVCEYVPGSLRDLSRATSSHATIQFDGFEQSEIWAGHRGGAHRVGGRAEVSIEQVSSDSFEASCCGWATPRTRHRRKFQMKSGRLYIEDTIEGEVRAARFALPLAPGLEPELRHKGRPEEAADEGGGRVELWVDLPDGARLCVQLPLNVRWRIESSAYFDQFGSHRKRACLVGDSDDFRAGTWRFSVGGASRSQSTSRPRRGRPNRRRG